MISIYSLTASNVLNPSLSQLLQQSAQHATSDQFQQSQGRQSGISNASQPQGRSTHMSTNSNLLQDAVNAAYAASTSGAQVNMTHQNFGMNQQQMGQVTQENLALLNQLQSLQNSQNNLQNSQNQNQSRQSLGAASSGQSGILNNGFGNQNFGSQGNQNFGSQISSGLNLQQQVSGMSVNQQNEFQSCNQQLSGASNCPLQLVAAPNNPSTPVHSISGQSGVSQIMGDLMNIQTPGSGMDHGCSVTSGQGQSSTYYRVFGLLLV